MKLFIVAAMLVATIVWLESRSIMYFAFGKNTNNRRFRKRAPSAQLQGTAILSDYDAALLENMNISPKEGSHVEGVLWKISRNELRKVDRREKDYKRIQVQVKHGNSMVPAQVYIMKRFDNNPPSPKYVRLVRQGYKQQGLPMTQLEVPPPLQG